MPRVITFAPALLLILFAAQQVAAIDARTEWDSDLQNALHVPWFATLTALLVGWSRHWRMSTTVRWAIVLVCMLGGAMGSEFLQSFTGRDAEVADAVRDLLGGGATLFVYFAVRLRSWWLGIVACALFVTGLATFLQSSASLIARRVDAPVLYDPDGLFSRGFATLQFVQDVEDPSSQPNGWRRLRLLNGPWQGIALNDPAPNWGNYTTLCLQLGVADKQAMSLLIRIHDGDHGKSGNAYTDRFNRDVTLQPGAHLVAIPLSDVASAPAQRPMNMADIASLGVYQLPPFEAGRHLDVGRIWLTQAHNCVPPDRR